MPKPPPTSGFLNVLHSQACTSRVSGYWLKGSTLKSLTLGGAWESNSIARGLTTVKFAMERILSSGLLRSCLLRSCTPEREESRGETAAEHPRAKENEQGSKMALTFLVSSLLSPLWCLPL